MAIFIALIRGINVGGKNIIKMADLKKSFEALGLSGVQTYIQSGNILFDSAEKEDDLKQKIEKKIEADFGIAAAATLRTAEELDALMKNCPFQEEEIRAAETASGVESLYAALLSQAPSAADIDILNRYKAENDRFHVSGRDIYLLFRHSVRDSKLAGNLQKLSAPATMRNFKTIGKLVEMGKHKK